jgi:hypothetical protein
VLAVIVDVESVLGLKVQEIPRTETFPRIEQQNSPDRHGVPRRVHLLCCPVSEREGVVVEEEAPVEVYDHNRPMELFVDRNEEELVVEYVHIFEPAPSPVEVVVQQFGEQKRIRGIDLKSRCSPSSDEKTNRFQVLIDRTLCDQLEIRRDDRIVQVLVVA